MSHYNITADGNYVMAAPRTNNKREFEFDGEVVMAKDYHSALRQYNQRKKDKAAQ